jgi:transcriptional regulator with XRE-family HTH domain
MADRSWRLVARHPAPFLLDPDWTAPLLEWDDPRLVEVARGTHRHVVRFLADDQVIYALKELPGQDAWREYRLLGQMAEDGLPVVERVGVVARDHLDDVLITRYLDFSLPYRHLFSTRWGTLTATSEVVDHLLDAMSLLLVRLHIAGYYWGDCSLNNTLLKRDGGALAAYVVDVETSERHPTLTDGQRLADLEITQLNVAGGLMDVQAELDISDGLDPIEMTEEIAERYHRLWEELNRDEVVGRGERWRIDQRIRRLNELGFHVDEVELQPIPGTEDGLVRLRTSVTEQGYHARRLADLTGIRAQENQARLLLNDLASFRTWLERSQGHPMPQSVAAYRWLAEVFEATVTAIPEELRDRFEPVEVFLDMLRHKWLLSEREGRDVGLDEAVRSYLDTVLPDAPTEKVVVAEESELDTGWIGFG